MTQCTPILPSQRVEEMVRLEWWRGNLLIDFLDQWASEEPERLAVVSDNSATGERTRMTYGELQSVSVRLAEV